MLFGWSMIFFMPSCQLQAGVLFLPTSECWLISCIPFSFSWPALPWAAVHCFQPFQTLLRVPVALSLSKGKSRKPPLPAAVSERSDPLVSQRASLQQGCFQLEPLLDFLASLCWTLCCSPSNLPSCSPCTMTGSDFRGCTSAFRQPVHTRACSISLGACEVVLHSTLVVIWPLAPCVPCVP